MSCISCDTITLRSERKSINKFHFTHKEAEAQNKVALPEALFLVNGGILDLD